MKDLLTVLNYLIPTLEAIRQDLENQSAKKKNAPREYMEQTDNRSSHRTEGLLTVPEAASVLSISKIKLYQLTSAHRIPHYRIGCRVLFSKEILSKWLEQQLIGEPA